MHLYLDGCNTAIPTSKALQPAERKTNRHSLSYGRPFTTNFPAPHHQHQQTERKLAPAKNNPPTKKHPAAMELAHAVGSTLHTTLRVPLRVLARAARKRPLLWPVEASLPVAGIDAAAAQGIHYTLRSLEGVRLVGRLISGGAVGGLVWVYSGRVKAGVHG